MENPYAPPQAGSAPRQSKEVANDSLLKRYRRVNGICCIAIGAIGCPFALFILIQSIPIFASRDVRVPPLWEVALIPMAGLGLLVGSALSLARRRAGAFGSAFVSSIALVYLGLAWLNAPFDQSAYVSTEAIRTGLAIAALPEVLILLFAACIVSTTVKIGRRRAELGETTDTEGSRPPLA